MEPLPYGNLMRLVRTARRRWIVRRALEGAAIGAAAACVVSLLLAGILWWQVQSSLNLCAALLATGALLGAVSSLLSVPSNAAAAQRIDRQYRLHDLLATALHLRDVSVEDPIHREVVRQAEAVAVDLNLTAMSFAKMSSAGHSAVVGLIALVLAVSAIASSHTEKTAIAQTTERRVGVQLDPTLRSAIEDPGASSQAKREPGRGEHVPTDRRFLDGVREVEGNGGVAQQAEARDGNAFAQTNAQQGELPNASGTAAELQQAGELSTGGASGARPGGEPPRGGKAANAPSSPVPWTASAQSREAALKMLNDRAVPDSYRDIVRDYFLRD